MLAHQLGAARRALPPAYTIVATFYDIGSGRLTPQERGIGRSGLELSLPREGGLGDLLAEAARPDRRFHAVVCTSIESIARLSHLSTQVEHELEQAGVALLVAEEGIDHPTCPDLNDAADPADC
jgi:site-specific DNA recombinase